MRKSMIVLVTSLGLGVTQIPADGLAASHGMSMGSVGAMRGSSGSQPSMNSAAHGPSMTGSINSSKFAGPTSSGSMHWSGNWRFRHHRFHHRFAFAVPFAVGAYAAAYDSCYRLHRVWTPWGWRWHRVYVCDYGY
jgi:hypothetical protein